MGGGRGDGTSPGLSGLGLHLVHPALVDVDGVGLDVQRLVVHDVLDGRGQDLPQGVLAARAAVEAHHHLDDGGVPRHDLLDLVHFGSADGRAPQWGRYGGVPDNGSGSKPEPEQEVCLSIIILVQGLPFY